MPALFLKRLLQIGFFVSLAVPVLAGWEVEANGRLVDPTSGQAKEIIGFNYVRLKEDGATHHTFAPSAYNPERSESALTHMAALGANTVRVFINSDVNVEGSIGFQGTREQPLDSRYLDNIADFLTRAQKHKLSVILSMRYFPHHEKYGQHIGPADPMITGMNQHMLHPGFIKAKQVYLTDFFQALQQRLPSLSDTLLAVDVQNELCYFGEAPITLEEGTFLAANGQSYELPTQRQQLMDDMAIYWVDAMTEAVRQVLPDTLINANIFTYHAVGQKGPSDFKSETEAWKNRYPFRPLALVKSQANLIDLHLYPSSRDELKADLESIEMTELRTQSKKHGKAIIAGEVGLEKDKFANERQASRWLKKLNKELRKEGIQGFLFWTYDTTEQPGFFTASENELLQCAVR